MMSIFFVVSLFGGLMSYISLDPMKSSFFLILSMLMVMPMLSFSGHVWYSYFVSLLFLSGIFVILVYFSSLSKFSNVKVYFIGLVLLLTLYFFSFEINSLKSFLGLNVFYYSIYWFVLVFILMILLLFMNFTSYFLNFSGALRKV